MQGRGILLIRVPLEEAKAIVDRCFEPGVGFFDKAHVYSDREEKTVAGLGLTDQEDKFKLLPQFSAF